VPVLLMIDLLGIQSYIFKSNKLRDVACGSAMISFVTDETSGLLSGHGGKVLQNAGGNAVLLFADVKTAQSFSLKYSRSLLEQAPGLEVVLLHHEYNNGEFVQAFKALQQKMARHKLERLPSVALLGLGVSAACSQTGLPAVDFGSLSGENYGMVPISSTIVARRRADLQSQWTDWTTDRFDLTLQNDELGRSHGEKSLLAVIHLDINGLGTRLADWITQQQGQEDGVVQTKLSGISKAIQATMSTALETVRSAVEAQIIDGGGMLGTHQTIKVYKRNNKWLYPLRPILLGGDDLTLLCDARLALEITALLLETIQKPELEFDDQPIHACAGIAIVQAHAPFAKAYDLASALCAKAKERALQEPGSYIHWQVGMRNKDSEQQTYKPYRLEGLPICWQWLRDEILAKLYQPPWSEARSKYKSLIETILANPDSDTIIKTTLESWNAVRNTKLELPPEVLQGNVGVLLDALEIIDLYAGAL
jgi:hypothetical protein